MHYNDGNDKNKQNDNLLKRRNNIRYSSTKPSVSLSLSSSLIRNSISLYPSALGIEILCILSSLIGESIGFYLFGFNPIGIFYAYSLGFLVAGFTIFLIIVGRYQEHKNINLGCHDDCNSSDDNHQVQIGFKSNFITTFKYFKNGWFNLPILFSNRNRNQLIKRAVYLILTAESICVITAQTIDLLFYNFSVFLSTPIALIAGSVVISIQQAEEINKKNKLKINRQNKDNNNTKNNKIRLQYKIVPLALSVNALLIILFVISGGYNHYDNTAKYSKYHTHLMNSKNETFFSAPDVAVVETDEQGVGINLDYLSIVKPDSNPINHLLNIPSSRHIINTSIVSETHPEGNIRFNNNQSIHLDFYECHNKGCISPQEIINVFTTNNNTPDKQIIEDKLKANEKILFVNSSEYSFEPKLSRYDLENNHNNLFNKLVVHTKQKENIEAFYIANVNLTKKHKNLENFGNSISLGNS